MTSSPDNQQSPAKILGNLDIIIENLADGLVFANSEGNLLYFNKSALKMHGFNSMAEIFNHLNDYPETFLLRQPNGEELDFHHWPLSRVLRGEKFVDFEVELKRTDTNISRYVSYSGTPILKDAEVHLAVLTIRDITDTKTVSAELKYQANLTKTITDNAASALFMMDKHGHPTFMNPAAMKVTGYNHIDEIKNKPLHYAVHWKKPDGSHYPLEECPIDNAQAELKPVQNQDELFCRKDGSLFPVSYSVMPLEKEGEVIGSVLEFRDVTEEKKIQSELMEREAELRSLANSLPQLAWMADSSGWVYWYNQRWYDYTGTTFDEMQGTGWEKVHDPTELQRMLPTWKEALKAGNVWEDTFPLRSKSGEYGWFLSRAVPVKDDSGKILRWFGTNTDITDQRRQKMELHEAKSHLEALVNERTQELKKEKLFINTVLDNLEAGIVACNAEGRLTLFNKATKRFHGLPKKELPASEWSNYYNLYHEDGVTPMEMKDVPLFRALQGENVQNVEMVIAPKNGKKLTLRASGTCLQNDHGEKIGAVVAMHDISDLLNIQKDLAVYNLALESSNKELEAFSYSVSHDLRAPLRGIDGFSKALLQDFGDSLNDSGKQYLRFVREGIQKMGQLIDDLLNLSRLSKQEVKKTNVDISKIATEILNNFAKLSSRKHTFKIQPSVIAYGDIGLLSILLENLLGNAWKFSEKKEETIIEFGTTQRDGQPVFFVMDNGAGFDMAYEDKLFGAFQRLHSTSEFKGTGIGLATVRRIVHKHGGITWAEGRIDQGATFYFTLQQRG